MRGDHVAARILRGDAGALHDRPIVPSAGVEVLQIEQAAVVLGSTQSFEVVNAPAADGLGCAVVRRRSGGGVVVLQPNDHVWIDVTVPRGHRLWNDDVEQATWWVGETWCEVLRDIDPTCRWSVHREKLVATPPERVVCFASVGPGEVVRHGTSGGQQKVVGISQRRTKDAARFQCTLFRAIDMELYASVMSGGVPASLANAAGVGDGLDEAGRRGAAALVISLG